MTADEQKLLIFTNSARVWRSNTRGDYWVLDLKANSLRKLGGADAKPATLMFAKFSPDGQRVGYVRENNIYVENLSGDSARSQNSPPTARATSSTARSTGSTKKSCSVATVFAGVLTASRSLTGSSTPKA